MKIHAMLVMHACMSGLTRWQTEVVSLWCLVSLCVCYFVCFNKYLVSNI